MAKLSKRAQMIREKVDPTKAYSLEEAVALLAELSTVKFKESLDVAINLGVDPRKSDQVVRGATVMPNGTGKDVRVAVFTQGANAEAAQEAGADIVGMDDLAEKVKQGQLDFDVVIASPDAMRVVGQLGQILGPRGLMPNPKAGTVAPDLGKAVSEAKAGKIEYRLDKQNIIHVPIGKASFGAEKLMTNLDTVLDAIAKAKPAAAKGQYFKSATIATTMGPGVRVATNKYGV